MRINACTTRLPHWLQRPRRCNGGYTAELQSVPSYRGKPHHAIAHGCIIMAKLYSRRENLLSLSLTLFLPDEILSHIIEFLHAFSRLAMLLLIGINIREDDPPARFASVDQSRRKRAWNACISRVSVMIPGNGWDRKRYLFRYNLR